jgi:ankyrin repeat protein
MNPPGDNMKKSNQLTISTATNTSLTTEVPAHFRCKLSFQYMLDPVTAPDGHTYERHHISHWLLQNRNSPMSRTPFSIHEHARIVTQPSSNFFNESREAYITASPIQRKAYLKDIFTPFNELSFKKLNKAQQTLYFESIRIKCEEDTLLDELEQILQEEFLIALAIEHGQTAIIKHLAEKKPSLLETIDPDTEMNLAHIAIQFKQPQSLFTLSQYAPHLLTQRITLANETYASDTRLTPTELAIELSSIACLSVLKQTQSLSKISNRIAIDILCRANTEIIKTLISDNPNPFINNLFHTSGITITHLLSTFPNPIQISSKNIKKILKVIHQNSPQSLQKKDENGLTPLHYILLPQKNTHIAQKLSLIKYLLSLNPKLIQQTDVHNNNLAHMALNFDSKELMTIIINRDISLFAQRNSHGLTPVDMSAYQKDTSMLEHLLTLVPEQFKLLKNNQWTMLAHKIINYNNRFSQEYESILKHHCQYHSTGKLLEYAIRNKRVYLLTCLLKIEKNNINQIKNTDKKNSYLRIKNKRGQTLLHQACSWGHLEIIRILEKKCPELFSQPKLLHDKSGFSPMHIACIYKKKHVIQYLHKQHKDLLYLRDYRGNTLAHLASFYNQLDIMRMLQTYSYGIIHTHNYKNQTPYQIAKNKNHKKMILLLLNSRKKFHRSLFCTHVPIHYLFSKNRAYEIVTEKKNSILGVTQKHASPTDRAKTDATPYCI